MHTLRTRFGRDIVAEFLPPTRTSNKVIILCDGMPALPAKKAVLEFFSKKGYWVFHPRYRGSWESGGVFLKRSPHLDILEVLDALPKGFKDEWSGRKVKLRSGKVIILGSSFGGAAALLCASDPRIHKVIALSPVVDWRVDSKVEPLAWLFKFVKNSFGQGYRTAAAAVRKLRSGKFYNPATQALSAPGDKILIIQPKDDKLVSLQATKKFASKTKSRLVTPKRGGHFGLSVLMKPRFYKLFAKHVTKSR